MCLLAFTGGENGKGWNDNLHINHVTLLSNDGDALKKNETVTFKKF